MNKAMLLLIAAVVVAVPVSAGLLAATEEQKQAMQNMRNGELTAADIPLLNQYHQQFAEQHELMERLRLGQLTPDDVDELNELHQNGFGMGRGFGGRGGFRHGGCNMMNGGGMWQQQIASGQ